MFLETQGWWLQTPGQNGTDFGHVHLGTCFPFAQQIRGVVQFDVRVMLHDNPGTLRRIYGGVVNGHAGFSVPVGLTCGDGQTCEKWVKITVDTTKIAWDGRGEFRFRPQVLTPNGNYMTPSTGWQAYIANGGGRPTQNYRGGDVTIARGWYTGAGYANSSIGKMPTAPVSGVWTPHVAMQTGAEGFPVTFHVATVDPNFHTGNGGWVVKQGAGPFKGNLSIDTTKLANGPHRLVLRADADVPSGSTNSGVLVIPFTVSN